MLKHYVWNVKVRLKTTRRSYRDDSSIFQQVVLCTWTTELRNRSCCCSPGSVALHTPGNSRFVFTNTAVKHDNFLSKTSVRKIKKTSENVPSSSQKHPDLLTLTAGKHPDVIRFCLHQHSWKLSRRLFQDSRVVTTDVAAKGPNVSSEASGYCGGFTLTDVETQSWTAVCSCHCTFLCTCTRETLLVYMKSESCAVKTAIRDEWDVLIECFHTSSISFWRLRRRKHVWTLSDIRPFPPTASINTYNNSECCCVISFYKTVKPQLTPRLAPFIGSRLPATPFCFFFFPRSPAAPIVSPAIIIVFIVLYLFVIFFFGEICRQN